MVSFRPPRQAKDQKSSGQGSTIFQRSVPFLIFHFGGQPAIGWLA
jgi:hypothetical protein